MSVDQQKQSVVVVYTGEGKGKTSAGIGLVCRSLGYSKRVAFVQFVKAWNVNEHAFFKNIQPVYEDKLTVYLGGKGFYNAGSMSAKNVSAKEHRLSAVRTCEIALAIASSGEYDLLVCDEINNAVHDGLLSKKDLEELISTKHPKTSLCLTGRNFPTSLAPLIDILSDIKSIRHHFDDGFIANPGIDY